MRDLRVHYLQHTFYDDPGTIIDWAANYGHSLAGTKMYANETLPTMDSFDLLIILGGTQRLLNHAEFSFFSKESDFIKQSICSNKFILGICLGAQLIAEVLGAKTKQSPYPEIGIFPIALTKLGKADPVLQCLNEHHHVLHMHYDMPGLLKNAKILATSEGCPNQAFMLDNTIYGLQFHLEITNENLQARLKAAPDEIEKGRYMFSHQQLMQVDLSRMNQKMHMLLNSIAIKSRDILF